MKHLTMTPAVFALALAVQAIAAAPATAATETYATYMLSNNLEQQISNIVLFQQSEHGGSLTWGGFAPPLDGLASAMLTNPFALSEPLSGAMFFALVQDLPGDGDSIGAYHVVLGLNNAAASYAQDIAWGTLFPNTLEEQLIQDILLTTSGRPFDEIDPGTMGLFAFADGDASTTNQLNGGFNFSTFFAPESDFTLMAWSDGHVVGSGVAALELREVADAVPEPATWAMLVLGFGAAGAVVRRRRATLSAA